MARRAAGHIRSLDAAVAVDYATFLRLVAIVGVVVTAFLLYWAFSPKSATLSLERLFHPRADIRPPTATQLYDVKPGELYVLRGAQPALSASVRGVRPQGVYAVWDGASFTGRRILLSQKEGDGWQGAFPPVLEDGGYYLAAGDTRTDRFGIHVVPRPAVVSVRLDIAPPAYTGLAPWTVENADVEAPAGARVHVLATTSLPPASGYMDFGGGRRTYLDPVPGGQALAGDMVLLESGTYEVRFGSAAYPDGSTFSNDQPVAYRLTCLPDKPPTATLSAPEDGFHAENTDTVEVAYGASDDYGVARVRLLYSVTGITMQPVEVAQPGLREVKDGRYGWDLATTSVQPGQTITYRIEAEDNRPGRGQTGQSEARRIVINPREGTPPETPPQAPAEDRQPPPKPEQQSTEPERQPPDGAQPAQQGEPPAAQEPAAAPQPPPNEGGEKDAIQKYVDYVRSIYDALGVEPPGKETAPGDQTASGQKTGETERTASGGQAGAEGQGRAGQSQQSQQGPADGGQTAAGQQAQGGGQPPEGAAGQAGQQGQGAAGQPAGQGAHAASGEAGGQEAGGEGAQGASGQSSGQQAGSQGEQGATGQGTGGQEAGSEGRQGAAGQQAGSQGEQGAAGQGSGQEAGSQGAQGAGGQEAGSEGTQGAAGQGGGQAAGGQGAGSQGTGQAAEGEGAQAGAQGAGGEGGGQEPGGQGSQGAGSAHGQEAGQGAGAGQSSGAPQGGSAGASSAGGASGAEGASSAGGASASSGASGAEGGPPRAAGPLQAERPVRAERPLPAGRPQAARPPAEASRRPPAAEAVPAAPASRACPPCRSRPRRRCPR